MLQTPTQRTQEQKEKAINTALDLVQIHLNEDVAKILLTTAFLGKVPVETLTKHQAVVVVALTILLADGKIAI